MKISEKFLIIMAVVLVLIGPIFVSAQSIVPCGQDKNSDGLIGPSEECTFNHFVVMIGNVVNGTLLVISVWAAISFMYAGYAYLTSGGSQEKVSYAKSLFKKVLIGYILILSAWAIVKTLEKAFYSEDPNAKPDSYLTEGVPVDSSVINQREKNPTAETKAKAGEATIWAPDPGQ